MFLLRRFRKNDNESIIKFVKGGFRVSELQEYLNGFCPFICEQCPWDGGVDCMDCSEVDERFGRDE